MSLRLKESVCFVCASCSPYMKFTVSEDDAGSRLKLLGQKLTKWTKKNVRGIAVLREIL